MLVRALRGVRIPLHSPRSEVLLFLLLWLTYAYFYQSSQHNEAARFDQVRSLIEHHTLAIDEFAYNTADVVEYIKNGERRLYPAKAPGTTLLAVVPFWLWSLLLSPFGFAPPVHSHLVAYFTTISTVGLLSALGAVAIYRVLRSMTDDPRSSVLAVVAVWLGSIAFPFSTLFFSHQQAASQLAIAFSILFNLRAERLTCSRLRSAGLVALAGFFIGFSVTTEYPTAILGALLAGYFVFRLWRLEARASRRALLAAAFSVGVGLGVGLLVAYNLAAFGRLAYTPYQELGAGGGHEMFRSHARGIAGVYWPGLPKFLDVLAEITVRPRRGLLYLGIDDGGLYACSPVLWLALPGLLLLAARRSFRAEATLFATMIVGYFTFNACYGDSIVYWGGGASVGPRHIIPVLPFVAIPLCFALRRLKLVFYPLLLLSAFYMLLATAVEPRTPYAPHNPWRGLYLPAYLDGRFALSRDGLFYPGHRMTENSTAFNLAKLAGVPGPWQMAPLMVVWCFLGTRLLRQTATQQNDDASSSAGRHTPVRLSSAVLAVYTTLVASAPVLLGFSPLAHSDRLGSVSRESWTRLRLPPPRIVLRPG